MEIREKRRDQGKVSSVGHVHKPENMPVAAAGSAGTAAS